MIDGTAESTLEVSERERERGKERGREREREGHGGRALRAQCVKEGKRG
jgi:hypothetical protein